jgi:thiol-disulfide isomerase/thioredoxin
MEVIMQYSRTVFSLVFLFALLLTACSGATSTPEVMMNEQPLATEAMAAGQSGSVETPAWFDSQLTNVNTGQTFAINDFKGKVILVETMAIWCPTCLKQQQQVQAYHAMLGENTDLITLSLDIDPNETATDLTGYAKNNQFDWMYAIAPPEVAREIGNLYGAQFLNPPSTPMLIIDRHGSVHPLPFGVKSADDLHKSVEPFLNAGM